LPAEPLPMPGFAYLSGAPAALSGMASLTTAVSSPAHAAVATTSTASPHISTAAAEPPPLTAATSATPAPTPDAPAAGALASPSTVHAEMLPTGAPEPASTSMPPTLQLPEAHESDTRSAVETSDAAASPLDAAAVLGGMLHHYELLDPRHMTWPPAPRTAMPSLPVACSAPPPPHQLPTSPAGTPGCGGATGTVDTTCEGEAAEGDTGGVARDGAYSSDGGGGCSGAGDKGASLCAAGWPFHLAPRLP